jgi:predicted acetyltransferase
VIASGGDDGGGPQAPGLAPVRPEERAAFSRLLQLYYYDFSDLLGFDVGDDGLFVTARPEGYWAEGGYHPFFVRTGGCLAGLAIVGAQSRLTGEACWDMDQFFVLRRHRRAGVGARAAVALFAAFPGRWEVREAAANAPAQAFWRAVVGRFTGGRFHEATWDEARWRGPVQAFESPAPVG